MRRASAEGARRHSAGPRTFRLDPLPPLLAARLPRDDRARVIAGPRPSPRRSRLARCRTRLRPHRRDLGRSARANPESTPPSESLLEEVVPLVGQLLHLAVGRPKALDVPLGGDGGAGPAVCNPVEVEHVFEQISDFRSGQITERPAENRYYAAERVARHTRDQPI